MIFKPDHYTCSFSIVIRPAVTAESAASVLWLSQLTVVTPQLDKLAKR